MKVRVGILVFSFLAAFAQRQRQPTTRLLPSLTQTSPSSFRVP